MSVVSQQVSELPYYSSDKLPIGECIFAKNGQ